MARSKFRLIDGIGGDKRRSTGGGGGDPVVGK
jgi:hypothetical protein